MNHTFAIWELQYESDFRRGLARTLQRAAETLRARRTPFRALRRLQP